MKCLMTGNEKCQPFNTGDCLIEVTEGAGFIVHLYRKYKLKNRGC